MRFAAAQALRGTTSNSLVETQTFHRLPDSLPMYRLQSDVLRDMQSVARSVHQAPGEMRVGMHFHPPMRSRDMRSLDLWQPRVRTNSRFVVLALAQAFAGRIPIVLRPSGS